jgi:serine/threonine protein phosphatase PrpC
MPSTLQVSLGQYSDKGRKERNQDFHGACLPQEPQLSTKGIAIALADGISSSEVSRIASEAAVKGFLEDYFCTSPAWSVKTSAQRVLMAVNSWLHAQTRQSQYRYDQDRGYVCTLSAIVLKARTAHLFHIGDARIYRLRDGVLEQLTEDHRLWVSREQSYLARALGVSAELKIDYRAITVAAGDVFFCATDGVYEFVTPQLITRLVADHREDLDGAARAIALEAYQRGSPDNLTAQLVRIDAAPEPEAAEAIRQLAELPLPPELAPRMQLDGYTIVRRIHCSSRSHVFLALDGVTAQRVAIKVPATDQQHDPAYLERLLMEDWIARRLDNAHVVQPHEPNRRRNYIYNATQFVDGRTLRQWIVDHPRPELETVRAIVEQIAKGLQAFHRLEMLHQDLRPDNIMIDGTGLVKIVDFGATRVAGVIESIAARHPDLPGTAQYTAPECFLGGAGSIRSDVFALGVITYEMLSGKLPYGAEVAKATTRAAQRKLRYRSLLAEDLAIPAWLDEVLRKATHPDADCRYQEAAEFVHELRHASPALLQKTRVPLAERNPLLFWKVLCCVLVLMIALLLLERSGAP